MVPKIPHDPRSLQSWVRLLWPTTPQVEEESLDVTSWLHEPAVAFDSIAEPWDSSNDDEEVDFTSGPHHDFPDLMPEDPATLVDFWSRIPNRDWYLLEEEEREILEAREYLGKADPSWFAGWQAFEDSVEDDEWPRD